jgi:hypothetical protein
MSGFSCQPLQQEQAPAVFPLVREAIPGLDLRAWLRFVRKACDPRRAAKEGIIVVFRNARPLPCGLFVYRRDQGLGQGPVLVAEHFVAVDLLDAEPVMQALIDELDTLAKRLGCSAIRAMVMSQSSQLASHLQDAGHKAVGETLWKELGTSTVAATERSD